MKNLWIVLIIFPLFAACYGDSADGSTDEDQGFCNGTSAPRIFDLHYKVNQEIFYQPPEIMAYDDQISIRFHFEDDDCNMLNGTWTYGFNQATHSQIMNNPPDGRGCSSGEFSIGVGFDFEVREGEWAILPGKNEFVTYLTDTCDKESNHLTGSFFAVFPD